MMNEARTGMDRRCQQRSEEKGILRRKRLKKSERGALIKGHIESRSAINDAANSVEETVFDWSRYLISSVITDATEVNLSSLKCSGPVVQACDFDTIRTNLNYLKKNNDLKRKY